MNIEYKLISDTDEVNKFSIALSSTQSRQQIMDIVCPLLGCDVLERIVVSQGFKDVDMMVDDIALLKRRPVNLVATDLYHSWHRERGKIKNRTDMPMIYGPVVLFDCKVWF